MAGQADFGLSGFLENAPTLDLGTYVPEPINPIAARQQQFVINAPRAQAAMNTKYSTYMKDLAGQYPPVLLRSLMEMDAKRVSNGQPPLTQQETMLALQSAQTQQPATPPPERPISSPVDWISNAVKDVGDIVRSIPKIPSALFHEATSLSDIPSSIANGVNPVAGLLQAPGVRLIPGTFVLGSLAAGTPGELLRHPVFTGLDVLPAVNELAKGSKIASATDTVVQGIRRDPLLAEGLSGREVRQLELMQKRPLKNALLNKLGAEGELLNPETGLPIRTPFGQLADATAKSGLGQFLVKNFGVNSRDTMTVVGLSDQNMKSLLEGKRKPDPTKPEEALAVMTHNARQKMMEIDPSIGVATTNSTKRMSQIVDGLQNGDLSLLDDKQLAVAQVYTDHLAEVTKYGLENEKLFNFEDEIYDVNTAAKLHAANIMKQYATTRQFYAEALINNTGDFVVDSVNTLADHLTRPLAPQRQFGSTQSAIEKVRNAQAGVVATNQIKNVWFSTRQVLRNAGYDTGVLDELFSEGKKTVKQRRVVDPEAVGGLRDPKFLQAVKDLRDGKMVLPKSKLMTAEEAIQYARSNRYPPGAAGWLSYRDILNGVNNGEWKQVSTALNNLKGLKTLPEVDPMFVETIRNLRDTDRLTQKFGNLKNATSQLNSYDKNLVKIKTENLAARFRPKQMELTRNAVAKDLIEQQSMLDPKDAWSAERIMAARDANELANVPGFDDSMYASRRKEAAQTVMAMKEQGFNPTFFHHVTPNRVNSSVRFSENVVPTVESHIKVRVADMAPYSRDLGVSLNDMGMQYIQRGLTEAKLQRIADEFGFTQSQMDAILHESSSHESGRNFALDYEGHKMMLRKKGFMELNPEELGMNWGGPYLNKVKAGEKVFVPIEVGRTLKDLTKHESFFGGVMEPVTKVFRIATTGLSLRTQLYNMVGGPIAAVLQNPASIKYWGEAWQMARDGSKIPDSFASLRDMIGSGERGMLELDDLTAGRMVDGVHKYMVGEKMRKWWDEVQAKKMEGQDISAGRYGGKFKGLIEKSYQFNGLFDDWSRAMSYMAEHERASKLGYTSEVSQALAIGKARQVLQDWLGMTPFERNIIKSVVPFYGFIGHAARFVLRYPFDHPLRAEILAKIGAAELEDNNQGLPGRFMSMLFFGSQDASGNQHALNLAPFNPFGDVANSMTMAGFLGNMNPVLQTAMDMVGLQRGQSELYPSLRYNTDTGRLEAVHPGVFEAAVTNIIPQSGGLLALMGLNTQYNEMVKRDPAAAGRYILGTLTLPMVERQYNVPQEQYAAELARQKSASSVLNTALKTGDWGEAMRYPTLAAYLKALDALPVEVKQQFARVTPDQAMQSMEASLSGAGAGVTTTNTPSVGKQTLDQLVQAQLALGANSAFPPPAGVALRPTPPLAGTLSTGLGLSGI